jgi:putative ABC transport system substrate-binding protein
MDRRAFITMVGGSIVSAPVVAEAQQTAKVPRIGVLWASTPSATSRFNEAFKQGLREHGYEEGRNVILEHRYGEGRGERMAEIAAELVRMKVDVIVAGQDPAIAAAKRQTRSIPIVMVGASDPVGTRFIASLARPGGNTTGASMMSPELSAKRLELLREAVPQLSRVAVMWNPDVRGALLDFKELEGPARSLRLQLQSVEVSHADDFARAFSAITEARAEAIIVIGPNPVASANRGQLVGFAQKNRLPCIYGNAEFVDVAGGLMAYGEVPGERWRRAAIYVDKILKGAKPGDLPVEQPTKFELVINLKTAKALGLTIPQSLLQRADQVIQ